MPNFFDKVDKWIDNKKTSISRTATKWTDDIGGLDGAAPRPSVRDSTLAQSKDLNLRTRASHKSDEEILRKVETSAQKMVQGAGGIVGAKGSVIARPHHTDSWGSIAKESGNYGRSVVRGLAYTNELNARGLKSPQQSDGEQWREIGTHFTHGAARGFARGVGSPQQASVIPQPVLSQFSTPHYITSQPWQQR